MNEQQIRDKARAMYNTCHRTCVDSKDEAVAVIESALREASTHPRIHDFPTLCSDVARLMPTGHVLTHDGVVRKVLGTLPVTADGCVMGEGARMFLESGAEVEPHIFICHIPADHDYDPSFHIRDCYSTREAASSAQAAQRGKEEGNG